MNPPKPLLAVIDTNILLVSVSSRSKFHWIFEAIIGQKFFVALNQEILFEYEEKISEHWNPVVARNVVRALGELPNVVFTTVYFHLNLIIDDEDDNKFVDCAFASNAEFIVTHDHHFDILKSIPFPQIPLVNIHEFKKILLTRQLI